MGWESVAQFELKKSENSSGMFAKVAGGVAYSQIDQEYGSDLRERFRLNPCKLSSDATFDERAIFQLFSRLFYRTPSHTSQALLPVRSRACEPL